MTTERSPLYFAFHRFADNKAAVVSGIILAVIILMAIFAPFITKGDPTAQDYLIATLKAPPTK